MNPEDKKVSDLTKVLVHKIHGGRKKDSKFWNSEYSIQNDNKNNNTSNNNTRDKKSRNRKGSINPIYGHIYRIVGLIFIIGFWITYYQNHKEDKTTEIANKNSIQELSSTKKENLYSKEIKRSYPPRPQIGTPKNERLSTERQQENYAKAMYPGAENIYCWKDPEGNLNFSNTGFPSQGKFERIWIKHF